LFFDSASSADRKEKAMQTHSWLFAAMIGMLGIGTAHAQQKYPNRPIRMIVPYAPGGGADVMARVLAEKLTGAFAVTVLVDNRPGGSGIIGTETAVRATPDGYTMLLIPGYEAFTWTAVVGPKQLSKDIVARWNTEINRVLQMPDVRARMVRDGVVPAGGSADRFREVLNRDVAKWRSVVKTAGIKPGD
jgi:tripartite-type tricarboxylate transporter receptor subunit TctC